MGEYRRYDISDLEEGAQMSLGRVFVSTEAQRFLDALTNGEGGVQLDESIKTHSVIGKHTTYHVGDVLHIETDAAGRTFVWIQSEEERPPIISFSKGGEGHVEDTNREA